MFILLLFYHIVISFIFISCVKKITLGQAVGVGFFFFSDLPYIVNSVVCKVLWDVLYLYELDLCCVYLRVVT
jgi:hypothetical protein